MRSRSQNHIPAQPSYYDIPPSNPHQNFPSQLHQLNKQYADRMRSGTGLRKVLNDQDSLTQYLDEEARFQRDLDSFASKDKRDRMNRKLTNIYKRRMENIQRNETRTKAIEEMQNEKNRRILHNIDQIMQGHKRTANTNGEAYNLISLAYQPNKQGQKLKLKDQNTRIRSLVRAQNMDKNSNSQYNIINGQQRLGVNAIVPQYLKQRFIGQLKQFEKQRDISLQPKRAKFDKMAGLGYGAGQVGVGRKNWSSKVLVSRHIGDKLEFDFQRRGQQSGSLGYNKFY